METFDRNNIKKFLKTEKKELMVKLTKYLGKKLHYYTKVEGMTNEEVSDVYDVPSNRVTEFQNYDKYKRAISELQLKLMIGASMVTVAELTGKLDLTEKEKRYLETLVIHEDKELSKAVIEIKRRGGNPSEILKSWLEKN